MKLRIGTRGSALALWQANHIAAALRAAHPDLEPELTIFKTTGDRFLDRPLADLGGKGLFTKELEDALLDGEVDLAVHSLKDMPTDLPAGLALGAIPVREDVRDCVITPAGERADAPAIVGTASLRRTCLAHRRWPKSSVEMLRGNVPTRLGRVLEAPPRHMDAVILAMAGLVRLGLTEREDVTFQPLDVESWIPAVGQGALAIEIRADDAATRGHLAVLHDADTARCVAAERAFLRGVEGDCRVPVGAHARVRGGGLHLRAFVGDPDGSEMIVKEATGADAGALGAEVAADALAAGGDRILAALRP